MIINQIKKRFLISYQNNKIIITVGLDEKNNCAKVINVEPLVNNVIPLIGVKQILKQIQDKYFISLDK